MRKILNGYVSLFRELLGRPSDGAFLLPPVGPLRMIAILGFIGFARNALAVALGAPHGFYSMDPDIQWTMIAFPVHLCFFAAALLHGFLRRLGYSSIDADAVLGLAFHLQAIHLIIPFIDWLGFRLGFPPYYVLGRQTIATEWFTNRLYMTPGIILAWWVTAYVVARVLRSRFGIRWPAIILSALVSFLVVLIPTYFLFPSLNTAFRQAFGPYLWSPLKHAFDSPRWFPFWGNATYFAITAVFGLMYFVKSSRREDVRSLFHVSSPGRAYAWLLLFGLTRSLLDSVWVPTFASTLAKILVVFYTTVYQFTLYLLIPAIAGFILERVFSRPVDGSGVLRGSVLVWVVYPAVTVISLILKSPPMRTIEWFRYIPTFMVDYNFLPAGMIAVIPILIVFYTRLMMHHSGATWLRALTSVLISMWLVYLVYYQYTAQLFLHFLLRYGPIAAFGYHTLTYLLPLFPIAMRFHAAFGRHRIMLPRLVLACTLISLGLGAIGLFFGL